MGKPALKGLGGGCLGNSLVVVGGLLLAQADSAAFEAFSTDPNPIGQHPKADEVRTMPRLELLTFDGMDF
jgi:hypothetical protein